MERRRNGFTHKQKREVRESQDFKCACCGQTPHKTLEVHHIRPLSMKGENTLENAVAACNPCHRFLDELALKREIFYDEQTMAENVEYVVGLLNSPHLDEHIRQTETAAD